MVRLSFVQNCAARGIYETNGTALPGTTKTANKILSATFSIPHSGGLGAQKNALYAFLTQMAMVNP